MCDCSANHRWACSNLAVLSFKESGTKRCVPDCLRDSLQAIPGRSVPSSSELFDHKSRRLPFFRSQSDTPADVLEDSIPSHSVCSPCKQRGCQNASVPLAVSVAEAALHRHGGRRHHHVPIPIVDRGYRRPSVYS